MMSPVWTPAHLPPHPRTISRYSSDAQIVLRALQAKYGVQLKKEELQLDKAQTSNPVLGASRNGFHDIGFSTTIKVEPPSTPVPKTARNESLASLGGDPPSWSGISHVGGKCELLLTQTHTTECKDGEGDEDDVQFLFQENRSARFPIPAGEPKKHGEGSFSFQKDGRFSLQPCMSPPLVSPPTETGFFPSIHGQNESSCGQPSFCCGPTPPVRSSPAIDLSPVEEDRDIDSMNEEYPILAPCPGAVAVKDWYTARKPTQEAVMKSSHFGSPYKDINLGRMDMFCRKQCSSSTIASINDIVQSTTCGDCLENAPPEQSGHLRPSALMRRMESLGPAGQEDQPEERSGGTKRQKMEIDDHSVEDIEKLLGRKSSAQPKKKTAGFKVPVKPTKKLDSDGRQTKITEMITSKQIDCTTLTQSATDITNLSRESISCLLVKIRDASEVGLTLSYQSGGTQLREALTEKKRGSKIDHKISGLYFTTYPENGESIHYIPFSDARTEAYCRDVVIALLNSKARKICYCAQECIKAIVVQFHLTNAEVLKNLVVMEPKIACWLCDSDNPVTSFKEVLKKCGTEQSDGGSVEADLKQLSSVMELLYQRLSSEGQWPLFLRLEMRLTPILSLMELRGIRINAETFVKFGELLKKKTAKVEAAAHECAGHRFLINSHLQLRQLLFEELKLDTKLPAKAKIARTSVSHQKSTSETVLNRLKEVHPLPGLILEYRQFQKLKSTYVDGMLLYVKDGYLNTSWDQTAAATGRLTSTNPNVQAIPKQPIELTGVVDSFIVGRESETVTINMRDPFVSEDGWSLLAADFQQIELRLLAHLADDSQLLQAFSGSECRDIFIELTRQWLGKQYSDITTDDREKTKRVVYSVMYGVGKERLADYLKMSPDNAKAIMQSFLVRFPGVKSFTNQAIETCQRKGYTQTIFKRRRLIPNILHKSPVLRAQAERQAVNFCVQGSAADLCKAAMVQVEHALLQRPHLRSRLLIQIHDELLLEVPDEELKEVKDLVKSIMESSTGLCGDMVKLKVPLRVSVSCGKKWGHMESC